MKKQSVLADEVTINTPPMSKFLKRNVLINNGFPNHSKYKFWIFRTYRKWMGKSRYHMKR